MLSGQSQTVPRGVLLVVHLWWIWAIQWSIKLNRTGLPRVYSGRRSLFVVERSNTAVEPNSVVASAAGKVEGLADGESRGRAAGSWPKKRMEKELKPVSEFVMMAIPEKCTRPIPGARENEMTARRSHYTRCTAIQTSWRGKEIGCGQRKRPAR